MTMMKHILTLILLCCSVVSHAAAPAPSWITTRPVDDNKYIGIARVPLSDAECRTKASKLALDEIAMQISVNSDSESFMRMLVVDGRSKELFEKRVTQSVSVELEGQKIKDSYESSTHYYVYYELDKKTYFKSVEQRRNNAIHSGLDLYTKGAAAEQANNLVSAAQLYANGLTAIEPYLNLNLVTTHDGRRFNVPNELYNAYINLFNGLVITTNVKEMAVEAFKPDQRPIAACLSRNNQVLSNVELSAKFTSGSGSITPSVKSDVNGTAIFYLSNVTSKQPIQSISIGVGDTFMKGISESYKSLLSGVSLPSATIALALVSSNYTAYFDVESNDLTSCEQQIKTLLANNYFEFNDNTNADLYVLYSTEFKVGGTVAGEMSDFNECFCSLKLNIFNNKSQSMLLKYAIADHRVLVPMNQSAAQAKMTCARELVKQFKRELPQELKKLNLNLK